MLVKPSYRYESDKRFEIMIWRRRGHFRLRPQEVGGVPVAVEEEIRGDQDPNEDVYRDILARPAHVVDQNDNLHPSCNEIKSHSRGRLIVDSVTGLGEVLGDTFL